MEFEKETIIAAIKKIDENPELRKNRNSSTYDLYYNGKKYPPILVLSIANQLNGNKELFLSDFNNKIELPFSILRASGFEITKKKAMVNYWIEKTITKKRIDRLEGDRALGKALWSPQKDKRGAEIYKNMTKVESGDLILHLVDNSYFSGISKVKNSAIKTKGVEGTDWDGDAYLIELENYTPFKLPLSRTDILKSSNRDILRKISSSNEVFYNKKLDLRQGAYLTPCPIELLELINQEYYNLNQQSIPFLDLRVEKITKLETSNFDYFSFVEIIKEANLKFSNSLICRFIASLITKPFVILTGLSGSGKTKLAQAFVHWICQEKSQYRIIPVGADWTNREPLLGYPNALNTKEYVKPDNGVIDLILQANSNPKLPHFLILDEMNLSHVERYFADFLSVMESNESIPLYDEKKQVENGVPSKLKVPANLFIIGTVNIDETTNMFSPKVLDRANTIEFRINKDEMKNFLNTTSDLNMKALLAKGENMATNFIKLSEKDSFTTKDLGEINKTLLNFFGELQKTGAEFGYRSASEILRLINQLDTLNNELSTAEKIDIAIMQKLLPKLHGSRRKLSPILETLGGFCVMDKKIVSDKFRKEDFDFTNEKVLYPLSLEKIARMYKGALDNGFASYAEA